MHRIVVGLALVLSACAHGSTGITPPLSPHAADAARNPAASQLLYHVIDLGIPAGYTSSQARALNGQDIAAGQAYNPAVGGAAVLFTNGAATVLRAPSNDGAAGINNARDIVYSYEDSNGVHAVVQRASGQLVMLASQGQPAVHGINERGEVAGYAFNGGRAILWDTSGTPHDLGLLPGGNGSQGYALNNFGVVVGNATLDNGQTHAAEFRAGTVRDLGTLGGSRSNAMGVNDGETIVGYSYLPGDAHFHAFVFDGRIHDLSAQQPMTDGTATGINERGDVVGWTGGVATLWRQGQQYDLNTVIPANSGWILVAAYAINERGDIVGTGYLNGIEHAFLLLTH